MRNAKKIKALIELAITPFDCVFSFVYINISFEIICKLC